MALHIKKIKPLYSNILVTGDKYETDMVENGVITSAKGDLKLYQKVLAVGSMVRDIQVGDTVMFNPQRYAEKKYDPNSVKEDMGMNKIIKWNLPWVTIDNELGEPQDCLMLTEQDIQYVFEGEELNESIIVPDKPKFEFN